MASYTQRGWTGGPEAGGRGSVARRGNVISSIHARLSRTNRPDQLLLFAAGVAVTLLMQVIVLWVA